MMALLTLLALLGAAAGQSDVCAFTRTQPRYSAAIAERLVVWNAASQSPQSIFLNDVLLRAVTRQLGVADCQVGLSQGEQCSAALAATSCPDPLWLCAGEITISNSVYEAARSGVCDAPPAGPNATAAAASPAAAPSVCQTLASYPVIRQYVASGSCDPVCFAEVSHANGSSGTLAPPPPPPSALDTCFAFHLVVATPTPEAASLVAVNMANATTRDALAHALASFAAPGATVKISMGDTGGSRGACAVDRVRGASCGQGMQTRALSCHAADGSLLPLSSCPGASKAAVTRVCNSSDCTAPYWDYSGWSPCSALCGGGTATRTATCVAPKGKTCASAPANLTTDCNTSPCAPHTWRASAWGECNSACGGGQQSRQVTCTDAAGALAPDAACAGLPRPVGSQACNMQACDFCSTGNTCSSRGSCSAGVCSCASEDYSGMFCEVPANCTSKLIDAAGACCPSGLLDTNGTCCAGSAALDGQGQCCLGTVDACGVCGGSAMSVDVAGACCPTTLDANGMCCSGSLDECGVCDGLSDSCAIEMQLGLAVEGQLTHGNGVEEEPLQDFLDALSEQLGLPPGSMDVGMVEQAGGDAGSFAIAEAPAAGAATAGDRLVVSVTLEPNASAPVDGRVGICGNNVCEIGERALVDGQPGTCSQDCGFPTQPCPSGCSGTGTCLPSSGICLCFAGNRGAACDACASGYVRSRGGACVPDVVTLGLNSQLAAANGVFASNANSNGSSTAPGANPPSGNVTAAPPASPYATAGSNTTAVGGGVTSNSLDGSSVPEDSSATTNAGTTNSVPTSPAPPSDGGGTNLGAILGPIFGVMGALLVGGAVFVVRRRRRQFYEFGMLPGSAGAGPGRSGDIESQGYFSNGSPQSSLREQYSQGRFYPGSRGASRPITQQEHSRASGSGSGTASDASRGGEPADSSHQLALAGAPAADGLHASVDATGRPLSAARGHSQPMLGGSKRSGTLGRSVTASTEGLLPALAAAVRQQQQDSAGSVALAVGYEAMQVRCASMPCSAATLRLPASGAGANLPAGLGALSLAAATDTPAPAESLAVMPGTALPSRLGSTMSMGAIEMGQFEPHRVLVRSYTASPMDPSARLFYNPCFGSQEDARSTSSVISQSHIPLPPRLARIPASPNKPDLAGGAGQAEKQEGVARNEGGAAAEGRRSKLERLRAAVEALEADAAAGRLSARGRVALPDAAPAGRLESPSASLAELRQSMESIGDRTNEANSSPITLSQTEGTRGRPFLAGRPSVPRLTLGRLGSITATAPPLPPTLTGNDAATVRPGGPAPVSAAAPESAAVEDSAGVAAPAAFALPSSARQAIVEGIHKLLGSGRKRSPKKGGSPLKSGAAGDETSRRSKLGSDWAAQLSQRGIGTPHSWQQDSGMLRTQPGTQPERALALTSSASANSCAAVDASTTSEVAKPQAASAAGTPGSAVASRYMAMDTPRGQLLRALAAEATVTQHEEQRALAPAPSYEEVLATVERALHGSPSRIPKPAAQPARAASPSRLASSPSRKTKAALGTRHSYASPSNIPGPTDENAGPGLSRPASVASRIAAWPPV
eukprot:scaffold3.g6694.t1